VARYRTFAAGNTTDQLATHAGRRGIFCVQKGVGRRFFVIAS
jgi:hypothetical protein